MESTPADAVVTEKATWVDSLTLWWALMWRVTLLYAPIIVGFELYQKSEDFTPTMEYYKTYQLVKSASGMVFSIVVLKYLLDKGAKGFILRMEKK